MVQIKVHVHSCARQFVCLRKWRFCACAFLTSVTQTPASSPWIQQDFRRRVVDRHTIFLVAVGQKTRSPAQPRAKVKIRPLLFNLVFPAMSKHNQSPDMLAALAEASVFAANDDKTAQLESVHFRNFLAPGSLGSSERNIIAPKTF